MRKFDNKQLILTVWSTLDLKMSVYFFFTHPLASTILSDIGVEGILPIEKD